MESEISGIMYRGIFVHVHKPDFLILVTSNTGAVNMYIFIERHMMYIG